MKKMLAAALLVFALPPVFSAEPATALTLDECLALSSRQHPAIAAAQAGVAAAAEAVGEARAPYYPQVDLSAGYHRWQRRAFLPAGLGLLVPGGRLPSVIGPLDDWNGGLQSRLTLYDFGERKAGLDAAVARRGGAADELASTRADVRLNVQSAFYEFAAAQDLRVVAEKSLARAESHGQLAADLRAAGAVPQADVLRAQAGIADARLDLIAAESRVRTAAGRLNTSIGRPAETPLQIVAPSTAAPPPDRAAVLAASQRALAQRAEVAAARKRVAAARASVTAARAARAPKLLADGSYGWRDTVWVPETHEWQAGVTVEVPIFDGRARSSRVARTKAEAAREEAAFESEQLEVRQEVWAAAAELDRAWAAIGASEASVRANEEGLRVVQERYRHGAALFTDLLDTQTALARGEAALADARWSYLRARAAFDRSVGAGE